MQWLIYSDFIVILLFAFIMPNVLSSIYFRLDL